MPKVAITRAAHQAKELADLLSAEGFEVFLIPTIKIVPNEEEIRKFKKSKDKFDYIIFTSANAVDLVLNYVDELDSKIIAIGPKTKKRLEKFGYKARYPKQYIAEGIIEEFKEELLGRRVAIPRSKIARRTLVEELKKICDVKEFQIYTVEIPSFSNLKTFLKEKIDAIIFTSPSTARNIFLMSEKLGKKKEIKEKLNKMIVISIGPITTKTLKELGVFSVITAEEYTIEGVVKKLKEVVHGN